MLSLLMSASRTRKVRRCHKGDTRFHSRGVIFTSATNAFSESSCCSRTPSCYALPYFGPAGQQVLSRP